MDQSLISTQLRSVITLTDILEDIKLGYYIKLPKIVTVGFRGSGKSSLIEQIIGLDFLPCGPGVVTRRPLQINMRYQKDLKQPYANFAQNPSQKITNFAKVKQIIQFLTNKICGNRKNIIDKPIILDIYSSNCPNLTIIDLPGLTLFGQDQNIKKMINKYMQQPSTIILCVIPGNKDFTQSQVLHMARKIDVNGQRTIGCITMIDIMDHGTDARALLMNKGQVSLKLGYVGIKNRSQIERNQKKTVQQAIQDEKIYFSKSPIYSSLPPQTLGTTSLVNKLTQILTDNICQYLPQLIDKIKQRKSQLKQIVKSWGSLFKSWGNLFKSWGSLSQKSPQHKQYDLLCKAEEFLQKNCDFVIKNINRKEKFYNIIKNQSASSIQHLDLPCDNVLNTKAMLNAKDMETFVKADLPNLTKIQLSKAFLNIENNKIQDEGVKILCQKQYKSLKYINLNNNEVSLVGLSHIVKNNWNDNVTYQLDTVKSSQNNRDGFVFNVSTSISTMKKIIKQNVQNLFDLIDKQAEKNQRGLLTAFQLLMKVPIQDQAQKIKSKSKQIQQKLILQSQKQPISLSTILIHIKKFFQTDCQVTFCEKSDVKSKLSSKIYLGLQKQRIKIKHTLNSKYWDYEEIAQNNQKLLHFKNEYIDFLAKQYNANAQDIIIHQITKGSTIYFSVDHANPLLKNQYFCNQPAKVVSFFDSLSISAQHFDQKGHFNFPKSDKSKPMLRGGIPYFQPIWGTRFGIKVSNIYENDNWLSMKGVQGEWAVGFHGIKQPKPEYNNMKVLQSIMSGRQSGEMLKAGKRQKDADDNCVNKPGQKVGPGIYISPYFSTCLLEYTNQVKQVNQVDGYRVVLQCRFKPQSLKCTQKEDYWVINDSKDIRPYGIILFTKTQYDHLSKLGNSIYPNKGCHWNSQKDQYYKFIKKNIYYFSVDHTNPLLKNQYFCNQPAKVVSFFDSLSISVQHFDPKGHFNFPKSYKSKPKQRGGIPYFQPIWGTRFGLKVSNIYENDNWLSMQGHKGEWAVGFYGIQHPESKYNNMTVLQLIMSGRLSGEMLKAGNAQVYENGICVNKPGQKVGRGIYISPYFSKCLEYTSQVNGYRVVLQCRFKPQSLKCTPHDDYWVINNSKDIRPYGIILFTKTQYDHLSKLGNSIYPNKGCHWNSWKDQYHKFINKN